MKSKMGIALVFALVCTAASTEGPGISYQERCGIAAAGGFSFSRRVHTANKKALYLLDPGGGEKRQIYMASGAIRDFALSPRCDLLASTEYIGDTGELLLVLLDVHGEVVLKVPGVYDFSWATDGKSIAYIEGINYEGGLGFRPTSIWVYRVDDALTHELPCTGYDLAWAEHDGNLYTWDLGHWTGVDVYRYDPRNNEMSATSHRGIFFSPDGKHYYLPSYEGGTFGLYTTDTDADMTEGVTSFGRRDIVWFRGWLNDSILVRPSQTSGIFQDTLINIETDTQCVLPGEVVSFPIEGDTFKMWHEGKITEVSLDSLTFVSPEVAEGE